MARWIAAIQPYDYGQPFQPETHEFMGTSDSQPCVIRMELTECEPDH
jgi:hypothetical protein